MLQRIRTNSAPRLTVHPIDDPTARWLAALDAVRADPSGQRIWHIYDTASFAHLWYSARDAGERLRATALTWLYAHQARPGGPYPDPREPGVFSQSAILDVAARQFNLTVQQSATPDTFDRRLPARGDAFPHEPPSPPLHHAHPLALPQAWLVTFPQTGPQATGPARARPPLLMVYLPSQEIPQQRINFEIACMLGYVTKDAGRLLDPVAPPGISLMPTSPTAVAILHQFAIALLFLDIACPEEWGCHCNAIRRRFNTPPASHQQSTDTLEQADIARTLQGMRGTQGMQKP